MKRVGIIGSGNVGANTAFFIAENKTAHVTLVDIRSGLSTGKALDMMEAGPVRGYDTLMKGSDDIAAIADHDVIVLAAGRVRKPGETRLDLYKDNRKTVKEICEKIKVLAPNAIVINTVEPVDSLTLFAQEALGFPRFRVLGVGGVLDGTRLRYKISRDMGISPREISGLVIGPHRENMLVLKDTIRISGVPAVLLMGEERIAAIIKEVVGAGDTILQMAQRSTAYYAPSAATAKLINAIVCDTKAIMSVIVKLEGEYGVSDLCVSVPAYMGSQGVEKILDASFLSEEDLKAFQSACAELKTAIAAALEQLSATA